MFNSEVGHTISIFSYLVIDYMSLLKLGGGGGANLEATKNSGGAMALSGPPLESPLSVSRICSKSCNFLTFLNLSLKPK